MVKYHLISSHNESGASQTVRFGDSNALDAANSLHLSSILAKDNQAQTKGTSSGHKLCTKSDWDARFN